MNRLNPLAVRMSVMITISAIATSLGWAAERGKTPGEQRRWALEFRTRLQLPEASQPVEIILTGDWVSTVSAVRASEYDVALELASARIQRGGFQNVSQPAIEQVERRLVRRFWATYGNDGALVAIHFFRDTDPGDRNLLQIVASETQLVLPDPGRVVWTVLERDAAGSYLAIYNRDDFTVVKRKLKYVAADGGAGVPAGGFHLEVDHSELRFALDPDDEVAALEANNRMRIGVPFSDQPPLVAITETRLTKLRRSRDPALIGSLARAASEVISEPIVTHQATAEQLQGRLDDRLLEGYTTESLLGSAIAGSDQDQESPGRLAALFRRRPAAVSQALLLLRQSGPQRRITNALGVAGSPAAIQAIGGIARDSSLPVETRIDALNALVRVHQPSLEAMRIPSAFLDSEEQGIRSAARLMSGAMARAGRSEHRPEADAMDAALLARYRRAHDIREVCDLLAALGNSAGPSVLPVIEEGLRDSRVSVRAAAARELRLGEAPEVDGMLSGTMATDSDPEVRAAAIFAAGFRPLSAVLVESLRRAARSEQVDYVRRSAVSLLREHFNAAPGIRDTLAWVAEHDAQPGVRRVAQEALASIFRERMK